VKKVTIADGICSVVEADFSVAASWRNGSLVRGGPRAAAAAAAATHVASCLLVAASGTGVTASASSPAAPVGSRAADRASVRHEVSQIFAFFSVPQMFPLAHVPFLFVLQALTR
jgi:hypothetical protein